MTSSSMIKIPIQSHMYILAIVSLHICCLFACFPHLVLSNCCDPRRETCCKMVRFRQSTGVLILVVQLFGDVEFKDKNSKVAHKHRLHREHNDLY
jgi:hypothetical protein